MMLTGIHQHVTISLTIYLRSKGVEDNSLEQRQIQGALTAIAAEVSVKALQPLLKDPLFQARLPARSVWDDTTHTVDVFLGVYARKLCAKNWSK